MLGNPHSDGPLDRPHKHETRDLEAISYNLKKKRIRRQSDIMTVKKRKDELRES